MPASKQSVFRYSMHGLPLFRLNLLGILLCLACSTAHAKHIYQYTDKDGVVHFTDVKPPDVQTGVKSTLVHAEARSLVRSRQDGTDDDRTIVMVNESGGPITADVELQ